MRSYMKYNTVIYGFYRARKGIDFGKSLFVLEGIICSLIRFFIVLLNVVICNAFDFERVVAFFAHRPS